MTRTGLNPFELLAGPAPQNNATTVADPHRARCRTDRLNATASLEAVLDASEGYVPLWAKGVTLHWRFDEPSLAKFARPYAAKTEIRRLLSEAMQAWGTAAPIRLEEADTDWDFQVIVHSHDDCDPDGACTLASAFFPVRRREVLKIYPRMFEDRREQQVATLVHELGHVFGLRHYFAAEEEDDWPSVIFGTHRKFSIMNYGEASRMTEADKADLRRLYQAVWSGTLAKVRGVPVRLVRPIRPRRPPA